MRKIPGTTKMTSGTSIRREAGATELDFVNFITTGKVVTGKATIRSNQSIQVIRDQVFKFTAWFLELLKTDSL